MGSQKWAMMTVRSVRNLPSKREVLSLVPRAHTQKTRHGHMLCNTREGEWSEAESFASYPRLLAEFQASEIPHLKNQGGQCLRSRVDAIFWPSHVCTYICMCIYTRAHTHPPHTLVGLWLEKPETKCTL